MHHVKVATPVCFAPQGNDIPKRIDLLLMNVDGARTHGRGLAALHVLHFLRNIQRSVRYLRVPICRARRAGPLPGMHTIVVLTKDGTDATVCRCQLQATAATVSTGVALACASLALQLPVTV